MLLIKTKHFDYQPALDPSRILPRLWKSTWNLENPPKIYENVNKSQSGQAQGFRIPFQSARAWPQNDCIFLKDPCFSDPYFSKFSPAARKKVRLRRARFPHLFFHFCLCKNRLPRFFLPPYARRALKKWQNSGRSWSLVSSLRVSWSLSLSVSHLLSLSREHGRSFYGSRSALYRKKSFW